MAGITESVSRPLGWQPMETLPMAGKFLLATYAPTNWAYWVNTVVLHAEDPPRLRETRIRYARAWMHMPKEPVNV